MSRFQYKTKETGTSPRSGEYSWYYRDDSFHEKTEWENIVRVMKGYTGGFKNALTDDTLRSRLLFFCVYCVLSIVSAGMTVVNVFSTWHYLMLSTLIFSILNIVNAALSLISRSCEQLARWLFAVEMTALFTFFLMVGEPEGFSAIWMLMLPCFGLLLFRLDYGVILAGINFAIMIILFWTDFGSSLLLYHGYTESFMLRFPMLYLSFTAMGILFEFIRDTTQRKLSEAREEYQFFSEHDALTKLFNRSGFNNQIHRILSRPNESGYGLAIMDIDDFKQINDTYGHNNGDTVLKTIASAITDVIGEGGVMCRWGGEEFLMFFFDRSCAETYCVAALDAVRNLRFYFGDVEKKVTVSIGLVRLSDITEENFTKKVSIADDNLYAAKHSGKDQVVVSDIWEVKV